MKWKKSLMSMLIIMVVALISGGCSNDGDKKADADVTDDNFNENGLPIVDDEITLKIAGSYDARTGSDWNELETFQEINKDTNVKIDWKLTPSSDWTEKRNLMLASGDLPDAILKLSSSDVVKGGAQGTIIPLEDLIDKYAPNLTKFMDENPEVRDAITAPDGHIYSLPSAEMADYKRSSGNTLWINTEWLDKIDMDMPETTDEFKEALMAFKAEDMNDNGDPNDEVPLTGIYGNSLHGFNFLFSSFGTMDETFLVRDDQVEFVRTSDEYKEVIKYISSLYTEGLLDQETFSLETEEMLSKLASGDKAQVGAFFGWSPDQITNPDYNWDYESPILALKGPDGHQERGYLNPQLDQASFAITKVNENPAATIRWVDQAYEPEMSMKLRQGPNRIEETDDGMYQIIPAPEDFSEGEWRVKETPYNSFPYASSQEMHEQLDLSDLKPGHLDPDKEEWFELQKPNLKEWIYPKLLFTSDQYEEIGRYDTDIDEYTDEMAAKWITKGGIDEDWDEYIKNLKTMGLDKYTKVYQDGYDQYLENKD